MFGASGGGRGRKARMSGWKCMIAASSCKYRLVSRWYAIVGCKEREFEEWVLVHHVLDAGDGEAGIEADWWTSVSG